MIENFSQTWSNRASSIIDLNILGATQSKPIDLSLVEENRVVLLFLQQSREALQGICMIPGLKA